MASASRMGSPVRRAVPEMLAHVLDHYTLEDVSVEDPPLEEVIAEAFSQARADLEADEAGQRPAAAERT